jgi:hypothetical protein
MSNPKFCHHLIKKTAQEVAGAAYEKLAKDDTFYKAFPDQKEFIQLNWSSFIPQTRRILAQMLANPTFNELAKEDIADALIKDAQLPGNQGSQVAVGRC